MEWLTSIRAAIDFMEAHLQDDIGVRDVAGHVYLSPFFLQTGFSAGSFDAVLSECSFYVSGDVHGALREAYRLLKSGGLLLLSDVFTEDPYALLREAGAVFRPSLRVRRPCAKRRQALDAPAAV